ncbi:MAG: hypothetical protein F6K44_10965 [Moorea sp. SIO3E2]|nr:hypothetical protein [Moorena sp. SIO3E2]
MLIENKNRQTKIAIATRSNAIDLGLLATLREWSRFAIATRTYPLTL